MLRAFAQSMWPAAVGNVGVDSADGGLFHIRQLHVSFLKGGLQNGAQYSRRTLTNEFYSRIMTACDLDVIPLLPP